MTRRQSAPEVAFICLSLALFISITYFAIGGQHSYEKKSDAVAEAAGWDVKHPAASSSSFYDLNWAAPPSFVFSPSATKEEWSIEGSCSSTKSSKRFTVWNAINQNPTANSKLWTSEAEAQPKMLLISLNPSQDSMFANVPESGFARRAHRFAIGVALRVFIGHIDSHTLFDPTNEMGTMVSKLSGLHFDDVTHELPALPSSLRALGISDGPREQADRAELFRGMIRSESSRMQLQVLQVMFERKWAQAPTVIITKKRTLIYLQGCVLDEALLKSVVRLGEALIRE